MLQPPPGCGDHDVSQAKFDPASAIDQLVDVANRGAAVAGEFRPLLSTKAVEKGSEVVLHPSNVPEGTVPFQYPEALVEIYPQVNDRRMTEGDRLRALLTLVMDRYCDGKKRQLAHAIGKDESYVGRLFYPDGKKGGKGIGQEIMVATRKAFPLPAGFWDLPQEQASLLLDSVPNGKPIVAIEDGEELSDGAVYIRESEVRLAAGAGQVSYSEDHDSRAVPYMSAWLRAQGIRPRNARRFRVRGDSMNETLHDGDTVLVDIDDKRIVDGKVYAITVDGEFRVKRLYKRITGGLVIHSDNERHLPRDEELSAEQVDEHVHIVGRVRDKSGSGGL